MILLRCRRCSSGRLFVLSKVWATDNDVYRCRECGFLFSPTSPAPASEDGQRSRQQGSPARP